MKFLLIPGLLFSTAVLAHRPSKRVINDVFVKGVHQASVKKFGNCDELKNNMVDWNCDQKHSCSFSVLYTCKLGADPSCFNMVSLDGSMIKKEVTVHTVEINPACE